MVIYNNISELIGKTPLVKLNKLNKGSATILAKLEYFNPAGSIKDRVALAMIDAAEADGLINKNTVIIDGIITPRINTSNIFCHFLSIRITS